MGSSGNGRNGRSGRELLEPLESVDVGERRGTGHLLVVFCRGRVATFGARGGGAMTCRLRVSYISGSSQVRYRAVTFHVLVLPHDGSALSN